ncbi:uncharacterized protein C8Q71DRAFT_412401 [Rhodofomes roseus]|uniref:F-box domain-containing protein n=1 Tax=Rhodofomes roseus TaxID=34475 RepID=A0ABQ8KPW6_9APHY|nr:uncharacterized protein C8Q71DRAFT_412401 [Rhodofomes roseus]KAH9840545.1 hypothetical protein C8Q71DRAFT_412401 [Rhodofomes roseus]
MVLRPVALRASSRVPLEVQEHILEFIDEQCLAYRATLVCRAWYPIAVKLLYQELDFSHTHYTARLMRAMLRFPRVKEQLKATRRAEFYKSSFFSSFPQVFAAALPSLRSLHIVGLTDPLHPSFVRALFHFKTVTHLRLSALWLDNFHQLRRVIFALPALVSLDIGNINFGRNGRLLVDDPLKLLPPDILPMSIPTPTRLQTLLIDLSISGGHPKKEVALVRWLNCTSLCQSLSSLDLTLFKFNVITKASSDATEVVRQLDRLLMIAGPSLQKLSLPVSLPIDKLNLSYNLGLTYLSFTLPPALGWQYFVDQLHSALDLVPSLCLTDIHINAVVLTVRQSQSMPEAILALDSLHESMNSATFADIANAHLRIIRMPFSLRSTELEAPLDVILAPWAERGVIRW